MYRRLTRGLWFSGGVLLLAVGLIVLPLPIPFGLIMIAAGLYVLTRYTAYGRLYWRQLKRAFPVTLGRVESARRALTQKIRRR